MNPQLAAVVADLEAARDRATRLAERLSPAAWTKRPTPGEWSPSECVAHLNLTSEAYVPLLRAAIAQAPAADASGRPLRVDLAGRLLWSMTGPIPKLGGFRIGRVRTTASFIPGGQLPADVVMVRFERLQEELKALARSAHGRAIDRVKIASPFEARLRYNAWSALRIVPRHQHRHLLQAERAADG
jgi:hypothetical protein